MKEFQKGDYVIFNGNIGIVTSVVEPKIVSMLGSGPDVVVSFENDAVLIFSDEFEDDWEDYRPLYALRHLSLLELLAYSQNDKNPPAE